MSSCTANKLGVTVLACLVAAYRSDDGAEGEADGGGGQYVLERNGSTVEPTPIYRSCTGDADCTLVDVTCNGCCTRHAIASSLEGEFERARAAACEDYVGPECRCQNQPLVATCRAGRCVAELE